MIQDATHIPVSVWGSSLFSWVHRHQRGWNAIRKVVSANDPEGPSAFRGLSLVEEGAGWGKQTDI